ncbi:N-acetyltransferase [bacterium]|nr:N-acetyltransferase [bacterium]MBU1753731.1 N-acetyltransferase [bacterium]
MKIRKVDIREAPLIQAIINQYAKRGKLLPRALGDIYENIRDYFIAEVDGKIVGCCALHVVWEDIAEVKSLAVLKEFSGQGIGSELLSSALKEARSLGITKIFTLTYEQNFFAKKGFKVIPSSSLPHKIWGECIRCPLFPNCKEVAMEYIVEGAAGS